MSSELQLDVCHLNRWRRHLVNAYEVKAGMVFIAGKSVWSMPECFKVVCIPCKAQYKCSWFFIFFAFTHCVHREYKLWDVCVDSGGGRGVSFVRCSQEEDDKDEDW